MESVGRRWRFGRAGSFDFETTRRLCQAFRVGSLCTTLQKKDGPGEPSYGDFSLSSATLLTTGRYLPEGAGSISSTSSTVT